MAVEHGVDDININVMHPEYERHNVLMICYYYPPLLDVGCRRSVAFSKYFKSFGWDPVVLSVKNPDKTLCTLGDDKAPIGINVNYCYSILNTYWMLGKINGLFTKILNLISIRINRNYFYDFINFPDHFWGWIPSAILNGFKLIKKYDATLIYVSCKPFSSAIVGVVLKKITGKPLVVDFRDPFGLKVGPYIKKDMPHIRRKFVWKLEEYLLNKCDLFIVTPDEVRKSYIDQYPFIEDRIFTIYNGIETEDFKYIKRVEKSKFSLVYTGNFYFDIQESNYFFEALSEMKLKGYISESNFEFSYYGHQSGEMDDKSTEFGLEDIIHSTPYIPYKEALNILSSADLMLLRLFKPAMGTKIFDAFALNVPMLAAIPDGEASDLIRKFSPESYLIGDNSKDAIIDALLNAIENRTLSNKDRKLLNNDFICAFSREAQAKKLMEIIENKIVKENN